jgi:oxygen-independent coproporphyrinogen-3 oxidase
VNKSFSLYIHVPFCRRGKCDYCDFYSIFPENKDIIFAYLNAVIADINNQIEYFNVDEIPTVYIGGGTPSFLGKHISILLSALKKILRRAPVEITVEANPESATEEFLNSCVEGGVNRLSLGVQTFNEISRKAVNRTDEILEERIALCLKYFPLTLCTDIITGLPYQNEKIVREDIKKLLAINPAHVSLYSLTVEKGTNLEKRLKNKEISLPDSETSDTLWLLARDILDGAGYKQYEVSAFAKDNKKCLHNIRYWRMEGWLGIGPSASGTVVNEEEGTAKRYTYAPDVNAYIKNPFIGNAVKEEINKNILTRESLLMGYRYIEGPDEELFKKRFGYSVKECIPKTISRWEGKDKILFLNKFLAEAFNELETF